MPNLTPEQKKDLRLERKRLINHINSFYRIAGFLDDVFVEDIEKAADRIKEIEQLIGYKPRRRHVSQT